MIGRPSPSASAREAKEWHRSSNDMLMRTIRDEWGHKDD